MRLLDSKFFFNIGIVYFDISFSTLTKQEINVDSISVALPSHFLSYIGFITDADEVRRTASALGATRFNVNVSIYSFEMDAGYTSTYRV